MTEEDHIEYMLRKQDKTISNWDRIMNMNGLFTDFEKPSTIKTNTKSSHDAKPTEDKPATDQNILNEKKIKTKKKRFVKRRDFVY